MLQRNTTLLLPFLSRSNVLQRAMSSAATPQQPAASAPQPVAQHANLQAAASLEAEAVGITTSGISKELLSKLKDPTLLHSTGLIGGKWVGARNNATYEVRGAASWPHVNQGHTTWLHAGGGIWAHKLETGGICGALRPSLMSFIPSLSPLLLLLSSSLGRSRTPRPGRCWPRCHS